MILSNKGFFITLEGIEGAGKSAQAKFIAKQLELNGKDPILTREPGGTYLGEKIRELLLEKTEKDTFPMEIATELLLIFAARIEHLQKIIFPAMEKDKIVICDRFVDSSFAYQGAGRGFPEQQIKQLEQWMQFSITNKLKPDLTFLLDISVKTGLLRNTGNNTGQTDMFNIDRFDSAFDIDNFMSKARQSFLNIAQSNPHRVVIIDAEQSIDKVKKTILNILKSKNLIT